MVVINPVLRFIPAEVQSGLPMDPRRTAALPRKPVAVALNDNAPISALRRRFPGLRRRVRQWAQPGRQSSWCLQLTMGLGWRARMLARPRSRPSSWLQTLVGNGTDVLLVAGERETRPIRFGSTKRLLARLARDREVPVRLHPRPGPRSVDRLTSGHGSRHRDRPPGRSVRLVPDHC